ncbi:hypothetical protein BaRGS_00017299 [Batillaria attramentaria]|uniref:Uncharacterized protein n=1 Tax=Batillaria attramentaria TaxID=370345 RepID=A0ABD0KXE2_9CAEN
MQPPPLYILPRPYGGVAASVGGPSTQESRRKKKDATIHAKKSAPFAVDLRIAIGRSKSGASILRVI